MQLDSPGHSSFLLTMASPDGGDIRILGDPWLSDYVIGDLMGRYPRVRVDFARLPRVHGIYLSHSHTDHLCPYSLLELWRNLEPKPALLVPESLTYLTGLLAEYLPGARMHMLHEEEPVDFHGLQVRALFNLETRPTNEDDVMMLFVESGTEAFLAEADALLPFGDPEARATVSSLFQGDELETACTLSIRNELGATMASVHATTLAERRRYVAASRRQTTAEVDAMYAPFHSCGHDDSEDDDDGDDDAGADLWQNPRLTRFVGGQGICFPQALKTAWNRVLFPLTLRQRARMEQAAATRHGCRHRVLEFTAGRAWRVEGDAARPAGRVDYLKLLDDPADFRYDPKLELFEDFPVAPLADDARDVARQHARVLATLNERFLPWLIGRRDPPVEHLLSEKGGEYRISVRYGTARAHQRRDYRISFAQLHFTEVAANGAAAHEVYWANDLEDFIEGRCDDFSTFCRHPVGEAQRLWDCLGMPYLNNDLVEKKLRFHFERAARGETIDEWALGFHSTPRK